MESSASAENICMKHVLNMSLIRLIIFLSKINKCCKHKNLFLMLM